MLLLTLLYERNILIFSTIKIFFSCCKFTSSRFKTSLSMIKFESNLLIKYVVICKKCLFELNKIMILIIWSTIYWFETFETSMTITSLTLWIMLYKFWCIDKKRRFNKLKALSISMQTFNSTLNIFVSIILYSKKIFEK